MIALMCRTCGKATDSDHSRDAVCIECIVRKSIAPDLAEYKRLWKKRRRYARAGANHNDRQISHLAKRMNAKVHGLVGGTKAIEFFNQLLHDARATAESLDGRILVAQTGDLAHLVKSK